MNRLTSAYMNPGERDANSDSDYWTAYDLYGSKVRYVAEHWAALKKQNGDRVLKCPICGLADCTEMDHFAPRSKFPEHSCHLSNLIPLCHNCNNNKGDDWLNNSGEQIFFNAFYDRNIPESIIKCDFEISEADNLIRAKVSFSEHLDNWIPEHRRIKETIGTLRLMDKFEYEANNVLNREAKRFIARFVENREKYENIEEFFSASIKEINRYLEKDGDFIEKEVLRAIISSEEFRTFISNQLDEE